ncbi:DMT family transporter [Vibrio alginolyticus]|uniref:DMT family transporter n=1 Tax=Vibrio alginolyticus TaxID=663 RepID=UPI00102DDAD8|nr:DMT family transporter [Vibrio alginolyticus]EJA7360501.1 DMT family transporter [Vibrio alginolyticus]MCG6328884.1 DMT family transporter [Vibrio alginolyticus]RZV18219.1 EamA family transporter [Vibrio alginolyticus]
MQYVGETAAIGAAIVWALATWIYSQSSHRFSALHLNIVKGTLASFMMIAFLPFTSDEAYKSIDSHHLVVLALSGIIGIAIGDTAYFASLKRIGPNKTLLLESLAPPISGVLALTLLGSALSVQSWFGVMITTSAVVCVIFQPSRRNDKQDWGGVGFGLLASVCQASGIVISHYALVAGDILPLLGGLVRLSVGVLVVCAVVKVAERSPFQDIIKSLTEMDRAAIAWLILAIFVGTFIAIWLQQVALKHANPAVAQTLIATSPLFMLLICALKGEKQTIKNVVGTLAALVGISLFFL